MLVKKIISGGQTGVDRAGLDAAIEIGIEHGGYAPKGRKAEDGQIPPQYNLEELAVGGYPTRTKKNIETSDGTLIFCQGKLSGGTKLTFEHARAIQKPCLVINVATTDTPASVEAIVAWMKREKIEVLNVAGPRLSGAQEVAVKAKQAILAAFRKE